MRVALVHDWLTGMRGGERVLEALLDLFPAADIFTLVHVPGAVSPAIEARPIRTSFVQRLPGAPRRFRQYLPLFPLAVSRFDLRGYDLVLATSHCVAVGARPPADAAHVVYCFTPMRYAWTFEGAYVGRVPPLGRGPIRLALAALRRWDRAAGRRAGRLGCISRHVAARIRRVWGREAQVLYPPVRTAFFRPADAREVGEALLCVSALDALQAGRRRGRRLHAARPAAGRHRRGPRAVAAPPARRPHGALPRLATRRRRAAGGRALPGVPLPGGGGVRHRPARGHGGRAAGHRLRTRRPDRDGGGRRDRPLLPGADRGRPDRRARAERGDGLEPGKDPRARASVRRGDLPPGDGRLRGRGRRRGRAGRRGSRAEGAPPVARAGARGGRRAGRRDRARRGLPPPLPSRRDPGASRHPPVGAVSLAPGPAPPAPRVLAPGGRASTSTATSGPRPTRPSPSSRGSRSPPSSWSPRRSSSAPSPTRAGSC